MVSSPVRSNEPQSVCLLDEISFCLLFSSSELLRRCSGSSSFVAPGWSRTFSCLTFGGLAGLETDVETVSSFFHRHPSVCPPAGGGRALWSVLLVSLNRFQDVFIWNIIIISCFLVSEPLDLFVAHFVWEDFLFCPTTTELYKVSFSRTPSSDKYNYILLYNYIYIFMIKSFNFSIVL